MAIKTISQIMGILVHHLPKAILHASLQHKSEILCKGNVKQEKKHKIFSLIKKIATKGLRRLQQKKKRL